MSFIKFLKEATITVDTEDENAMQELRNKKRMGSARASRDEAQEEMQNAKAKQQDPNASPQEKALAQKRARLAQEQKRIDQKKAQEQRQQQSQMQEGQDLTDSLVNRMYHKLREQHPEVFDRHSTTEITNTIKDNVSWITDDWPEGEGFGSSDSYGIWQGILRDFGLKNDMSESIDCEWEVVYVDDQDNVLTESAVRQFKRIGNTIKRRYRCLSGPKAGKLVAKPYGCATRKDPRKVRQGRKLMRSKKGTIQRKARVTKGKSLSRMVTRMNKRLSGKL